MLKTQTLLLLVLLAGFSVQLYGQNSKFQFVQKQFDEQDEEAENEPQFTYPQIVGNTPAISKFNTAVQAVAEKEMKDKPDQLGYKIIGVGEDLISISFSSYYEGGAHGSGHTFTFNYDLKSNHELKLKDLFAPGANYLKLISDYSIAELRKTIPKEYLDDEEMLRDGASAKAENYKNWTISNDGIHFDFGSYQVAPYVAGTYETVLPYSKIPKNMQSEVLTRAKNIIYYGDSAANWCRKETFSNAQPTYKAKILGAKNAKIFFTETIKIARTA